MTSLPMAPHRSHPVVSRWLSFALTLTSACSASVVHDDADPCGVLPPYFTSHEAVNMAACQVPDIRDAELLAYGSGIAARDRDDGRFKSWEIVYRKNHHVTVVTVHADDVGVHRTGEPPESPTPCTDEAVHVFDSPTVTGRALALLDPEERLRGGEMYLAYVHHLPCVEWSRGGQGGLRVHLESDFFSTWDHFVVFDGHGEPERLCDSAACNAGAEEHCCD